MGRLATAAGCRIIVAKDYDVGCVTTEIHDDHVWLDELFIAPAFQRRGIGSHVLIQVIRGAKDVGLPLRLSVLTTNPAIAFYRRHGLDIRERTAERIFLTGGP